MYGNQWNNQQGGGGYQQPQQTGYMQPQQTGYPQQQQMRPMQTGMPMGMGMGMGMMPQQQQQSGFLNQQPTGMGGMGMQQQQQPGGPGMSNLRGGGGMGMGSGMLGIPGQQQQRMASPGIQPQQTGYPGGMMGGGGLQPQATGYPGGAMGMMQPQMTGMPIRDPRLLLMSSQFLPSAQPFSGGIQTASNMNFNQQSMQPSNFQSSIQTLTQQQQGTSQPKIPWALSKEERKSYDQIFRAWDQNGTGFISGEVAREVFGQSGIGSDKLMQIWHLSDTENRGKLNLAEFHVAMGLIYRCECFDQGRRDREGLERKDQTKRRSHLEECRKTFSQGLNNSETSIIFSPISHQVSMETTFRTSCLLSSFLHLLEISTSQSIS